jgi:hypothetical protein
MTKKYISDVITDEEVDTWGKNDIITIDAGTGKGKSHFIIEKLLPRCINAKPFGGRSIMLILVNRVRLKEQYVKKISEMNRRIKDELKDSNSNKKIDIYKHVEVLTYHNVENGIVDNDKEIIDLSRYDYIVCDESHYFITDSTFNHITDVSLEAILKTTKATKIFMSATNKVIKQYITGYLKSPIKEYNLPTDYSYIRFHGYYNSPKSVETIIDDILDDDYIGGKVIYFCGSVERAYETHLMYKNISLFHCSQGNGHSKYIDNDAIASLIENERFNERILITTSALDNGVNIVDREVKHIIIDNFDLDTVIQMLGRKRIIDDNDTVNLYIRNMSNALINIKHNKISKATEMADYLRKHGSYELIKKYQRQADTSKIIYDVIKEDGNIDKKVNMVKYTKAITDKLTHWAWIGNISKLDKDYKPFISSLEKIIGKEGGYLYWVNMDEKIKINRIDKYLEKLIDVPLYSVKNIEKFSDDKKESINTKYTKEDLIDIVGLRDRQGKLLKSLRQMNNYLLDINSNYYLDKKTDKDRVLYYYVVDKNVENEEGENSNLTKYLNKILGLKLRGDKKYELINKIGLTDSKGKLKRRASILNEYLVDLNYIIKNESKTVWENGKAKNDSYWKVYAINSDKPSKKQIESMEANEFFDELGVNVYDAINQFPEEKLKPIDVMKWIKDEGLEEYLMEDSDIELSDMIGMNLGLIKQEK